MLNDTFYGPFYSREKVFSEMEKEQMVLLERADILGGRSKLSTGKDKSEYIQGYYQETLEKLEIYFTVYFSGKGLKK